MTITARSALVQEIALVLGIPASHLDGAASFITNGGDSLTAIRLQSSLRKLGLQLPLHWVLTKDPLSYLLERFSTAPLDACPCDVDVDASSIVAPSAENIQSRLSKAIPRSTGTGPDGKKNLEKYGSGWAPLTDMQVAFFQSTLAHDGRNVISYCETHRSADIPQLKAAWTAAIDSEPIFRTRMEVLEDRGFAIEEEDAYFDWQESFVQDPSQVDFEVKTIIDSRRGFGSRFRVVTLEGLGDSGKSVLIWQVHHALIDGYACGILRSKVRSHLAGHTLQAGPSFVKFARELSILQQKFKSASREYWKTCRGRFKSPVSRLSLPEPQIADTTTPQTESLMRHIPSIQVASYCRQTSITPATVYHAAWALVLAPYTNSRQISFGTVLSGRTLPIDDILNVVGPTMNTLPFFASVDSNLTVQEYLDEIFVSLAELTCFQWSVPADGFSRDFSTAINIQLEDICSMDPSNPSAPLDPPSFHVVSDVPIYIDVSTGVARLNYNTNMFSQNAAERILDKFVLALDLLQEGSTRLANCLDQISSYEWPQLSRMGNWNSPLCRAPHYKEDLVTRFVRTALSNPANMAVEKGDASIMYWDLHVRSGVVARSLSQLVSPGDIVCVHADRSINWIIAMYAVLKTGAVYCPIDSSLPTGARDAIFETSGAVLFLTGSTQDKIRPTNCQAWMSVEEILLATPATRFQAEQFRIPKPRPEAGAYLCFTSGSSGKPKGVLCHHAGLVAFQSDFEVRLHSAPGQKIPQIMSPGFDGSIHEIFSALGYGSTLLLPEASSPMEHLQSATAALMTPSLAKALEPASLMNLESVYLVGESVTQDVCDAWAPGRNLYNMYGPTEATCGATIKRLQASQPVTLGFTNPSSRIYILDDDLKLAPLGAIGEICLAGVQVAFGYIGQPEATAAKFVPDHINPHFGERMYRTGDRGYWNEDGEIVFLGRRDRQVKLRGFRIDLDDIEVRMQRASGCKDVAIALRDDYLVAQVQPVDFNMTAFQSAVRAQIPAYAMPRHFEAVDKFPLTPIGKKDYKAIALNTKASTTSKYTQSTNRPMELVVLDAVKEVLGRKGDDSVDLQSNLIELGATSMVQLTLSHRLSRLLGRKVPVRLLFESPTLNDLAYTLQHSQGPEEGHSTALGIYGVSPIEQDWWQKYECGGGSPAFNVTFACNIGPEVDRAKLVSAWNTVLARHQILRCRYRLSRWHGVCRTYAGKPPAVVETDHFDVPIEINKGFDLKHDDLIRVLVSPTSMLVVVSHIICDLTTLRILLQEAATAYTGGQRLTDPPKSYSQTRWMTAAPQSRLDFWAKYLPDARTLARRADRSTLRTSWAGTSYACTIPAATYAAMQTFVAQRHITMHQICLGAVALALQSGRATCDITLGAPFLNRNSEEDQQVVGLFLEPLPVRIQYPEPSAPGASFLDAVRSSSQAAIANAVPWDLLLSHLGIKDEFRSHALFDTMVSFHDAQAAPQALIDGLTHVPTWASGAKFPLMAEFTAERDGSLGLRMEYNTERFSFADIQALRDALFKSLEMLVEA